MQRLLDALASHNRRQARTAALIMWRTGLRVSEVLELEPIVGSDYGMDAVP